MKLTTNLRLLTERHSDEREFANYLLVVGNDTVDKKTLYPIEFINKRTPPGFPPHILKLKKKCCIMVLRNLDATNGHCNGTRYIIVSLHDHVTDAEVASGPYTESTLLIPRIPHVSREMEFPFTFTRKQFPVKEAFALTCNKTFEQVGIYLPTQFFSHGQLYVALSSV
uniref:DNA helicase Pif1-like 2B domain-containing protein n=1 Tax=Octopus bimaculoides TaxID=37653 RepID=A0A0L8HT74_OCTBM